MSFLFRNIRKSTHAMAKKTVPAPTVPAAIQSSKDAVLGEGVEHATFAGGCFWGIEHLFNQYYSHLPQWKCVSGYTGGDTADPTYRQLTYQKGSVGYGELVEFFYRTHDPTSLNSQGPDQGTQYRSAIFYHSPEQERLAKEVTKQVQDKYLKSRPIVTASLPAGQWWDAEDYHQEYLDRNPGGYECPTHRFYW